MELQKRQMCCEILLFLNKIALDLQSVNTKNAIFNRNLAFCESWTEEMYKACRMRTKRVFLVKRFPNIGRFFGLKTNN